MLLCFCWLDGERINQCMQCYVRSWKVLSLVIFYLLDTLTLQFNVTYPKEFFKSRYRFEVFIVSNFLIYSQ